MDKSILKDCEIFNGLSVQELVELQPHMQVQTFASGEIIINQGDSAQFFYVINYGTVDIYVEGEIRAKVATLQSNQFFGEMSCLTGDEVSATVEAVDQVQTIAINQLGIHKLMDCNH